jgi:hypothetical protein
LYLTIANCEKRKHYKIKKMTRRGYIFGTTTVSQRRKLKKRRKWDKNKTDKRVKIRNNQKKFKRGQIGGKIVTLGS